MRAPRCSWRPRSCAAPTPTRARRSRTHKDQRQACVSFPKVPPLESNELSYKENVRSPFSPCMGRGRRERETRQRRRERERESCHRSNRTSFHTRRTYTFSFFLLVWKEGVERERESCHRSNLEQLGVAYADLTLIHFPSADAAPCPRRGNKKKRKKKKKKKRKKTRVGTSGRDVARVRRQRLNHSM